MQNDSTNQSENDAYTGKIPITYTADEQAKIDEIKDDLTVALAHAESEYQQAIDHITRDHQARLDNLFNQLRRKRGLSEQEAALHSRAQALWPEYIKAYLTPLYPNETFDPAAKIEHAAHRGVGWQADGVALGGETLEEVLGHMQNVINDARAQS